MTLQATLYSWKFRNGTKKRAIFRTFKCEEIEMTDKRLIDYSKEYKDYEMF